MYGTTRNVWLSISIAMFFYAFVEHFFNIESEHSWIDEDDEHDED